MRKFAAINPILVSEGLLRMIALDDLVQIVPAHDLGAYDRIHRPTPATQPR